MLTTAILFSIVLTVIAHELGHAFAMRSCGVRVERISLLGIPGLGTIPLGIHSKIFPDATWVVHPLLLGAYVEPNDEDMENASEDDQKYILGMGPMMNFIVGIPCIVIALLLRETFSGSTQNVAYATGIAILGFAAACVLWKFRRFFCTSGILVIVGGIMVGYVIKVSLGMSSASLMKASTGPIGMAVAVNGMTKHAGELGLMSALPYTLWITGHFSIGLGLLNLVPIPPLDGGQLMLRFMQSVLPPWASTIYLGLGLVGVGCLMLLAVWNDLEMVFHWFF